MNVKPVFEQTGSIGADTVRSRLVDIETSLQIDSPASPEEITKLVATAERMCFLIDTIRNPHDMRNSTSLNGKPLDG